jgi:hypothetical protein
MRSIRTRSTRVLLQTVLVPGLLVFVPAASPAQSAGISGQIAGQVLDQSGAAITGVEVTARHTSTNLIRRTTTDGVGRYALSLLPLGAYEVTVAATGLEPAMQEVVVGLGSSTTVTFELSVGAVREEVQVRAAGLAIDRAQTSSKSVLTELQVQNLPASGRRLRSMFQLTPGSQIEPECGGFSVSGQKGTFININLDGGDCTSVHWTGHLEFSPTVGLEALEEIQVLRGTFSAEFGRSTGGIINMSTRSGTNELRGTGYYLFRNDALTRDDALGRQPIGLGQQFGASMGGPLRQDRTFFFVAPEFQRNTKPVETRYAALDTQNLRGTPGAQELLRVAPEGEHEALSVSRAIVTRIDHQLTDRLGLMGRLDYARNHVVNSTGSFILSQGLGAGSVTNRELSGQPFWNDRHTTTGMLQFTSVLSNRLLNEFRAQVFHESRPSNPNVSGPEVTVRNAGTTLAIYGPQATGLSYGNTGYTFSDTRYHVVNNVSMVTGGHTARIGVDVNVVNARSTFDPGSNGMYTFNSLADYLARRPFQYQQFAGTGTVETRLHQVAMYVQDEWRVRPGLTISPGLRYEMAFVPDYLPATVLQSRFSTATSIPDATDLVAPRLGLAWDPGGSGRTVLRAAGGLFYAAPYLPIYEQALLTNGGNPELSRRVIIATSGNPNAVAEAFARFGVDLSSAPLRNLPVFTIEQLNQLVAPGSELGQTVNFVDPDFRLPRATHFRMALERQFGSRLLGSVDYTSVNTTRIARVRNLNLTPPVPDATGRPVYTSERPYGPTYAFVNMTESSARSAYHGVTTGLNVKQPSYVLDLYYTLGFSRSDDDLERPVNAIAFDDAFNLENEYTWSNIDQRHQFVANGVFFLPREFEISTSLRFNSGRPFSALAGSDLNRDGVVRDRAVIDGTVVSRNTYRNAGFSEVNLRVQRGFRLASDRRLVLSVELFNLFDTDNVEIGSGNMVYGPGTVLVDGVPVAVPPPANFGQLRDADGRYLANNLLRSSPLQAQLGLRLQF